MFCEGVPASRVSFSLFYFVACVVLPEMCFHALEMKCRNIGLVILKV